LISVNDGAPLLLKNTAAVGNHWLGLHLVGKKNPIPMRLAHVSPIKPEI